MTKCQGNVITAVNNQRMEGMTHHDISTALSQRDSNSQVSITTRRAIVLNCGRNAVIELGENEKLGINLATGSPSGKGQTSAPSTTIEHVVPGGACDKAGLQVGDTLLKANGNVFNGLDHNGRVNLIRNLGSHVELTYLRPVAGPLNTECIRRLTYTKASEQESLGIGLEVNSLGDACYVAAVEDGSLSEQAGLKVGDSVLAINDELVLQKSAAFCVQLIKQAGTHFTMHVYNESHDDGVVL